MARATRSRALACVVLLLGLGALAVIFTWRRPPRDQRSFLPPPPDPRLAYSGRFRNVDPSVAYVGDAACVDCHLEETRSYREHPMGRSLAPMREFLAEIPSDGVKDAFTAYQSRFSIERRGEHIRHVQTRLDAAGQPIYKFESEAGYVIGSGTRGYSYLSDRDGFLFQTPISWFSQKHIWGLSPGFTPEKFPGRAIFGECLYCHANRTRPRLDTMNGYETPIFQGHSIGCERCHGPGERHVLERGNGIAVQGTLDDSIFNPSKKKHPNAIEPALRDAVCEQCHQSGETRVLRRGRELYDFRPGMELQQFWTVFVRDRRPDGKDKAVNHVEQMHESRCYQKSAGAEKLECVSCHNPHEKVAESKRVAYYRARCLQCHKTQDCTLPREQRLHESKEDSCIDCHMPRYSASDIPHTAATDHRIARRREPPSDGGHDKDLIDSLKLFYGRDNDRELARDRGVALMRLVAENKSEPRRSAQQTLELFGDSLAATPDDVAAWMARGAALNVLGRRAEALSAFENVLEQVSTHEHALHAAAWVARETGQLDKAIAYWRRAGQSNPHVPDYHGNLALLLAQTGAWDEARQECQAWLRLDPGSVEARKLLIRCLRQQGDRAAARREMELLRRLEE